MPALVVLVGGEAVQYIDLFSFDIVGYSSLIGNLFYMAGMPYFMCLLGGAFYIL
jgi:hypothetical protein